MKKFHPVHLLADDRGDDDGRHGDGRFRRPFAGDRLRRRIVAPACSAPDVARSSGDWSRGHGLGATRSRRRGSRPSTGPRSSSRRRLGTALGDWMADTQRPRLSKTPRWCSGPRLAILAAAYFFTNVSRVLLFWAAFILTRPLGATLGDLFDKPIAQGGFAIQPLSRRPRSSRRRSSP